MGVRLPFLLDSVGTLLSTPWMGKHYTHVVLAACSLLSTHQYSPSMNCFKQGVHVTPFHPLTVSNLCGQGGKQREEPS